MFVLSSASGRLSRDSSNVSEQQSSPRKLPIVRVIPFLPAHSKKKQATITDVLCIFYFLFLLNQGKGDLSTFFAFDIS